MVPPVAAIAQDTHGVLVEAEGVADGCGLAGLKVQHCHRPGGQDTWNLGVGPANGNKQSSSPSTDSDTVGCCQQLLPHLMVHVSMEYTALACQKQYCCCCFTGCCWRVSAVHSPVPVGDPDGLCHGLVLPAQVLIPELGGCHAGRVQQGELKLAQVGTVPGAEAWDLVAAEAAVDAGWAGMGSATAGEASGCVWSVIQSGCLGSRRSCLVARGCSATD